MIFSEKVSELKKIIAGCESVDELNHIATNFNRMYKHKHTAFEVQGEISDKFIFYSGGEAYFLCHRDAITPDGLVDICRELEVLM